MDQVTVMPTRSEENLATQTRLTLSSETISTEIVYKPSWIYHATKRFFDIALSLFGMIVLMPIFLVIAICIKLDDGGPILHFREIIGKDGRRFFALKFRTMIQNADDYLAKHPELKKKFLQNMKLDRDPRITSLGRFLRKTSLDELPQLFNVMVGQMSLVGPRMIHPSELPRYGEWALKRITVKPGITGLWQISGRQHISYSERVRLDMHYIDNRALWLDFIILLKTLRVFIVHTGA